MQAIAAITGGEEFFAYGSPSQYTLQLQEIFRNVGRMRAVSLIE